MDSMNPGKLNADQLQKVFINQLNIVQCAKTYLLSNIPGLQKLASFKVLKLALEEELEDIKKQSVRLKKIFELLDQHPFASECLGMNTIMEEAYSQVLHDGKDSFESDMSITFYMQVVEHIQMGAYRMLSLIASKPGYEPFISLLRESFDESRDNAWLFHIVSKEYIH